MTEKEFISPITSLGKDEGSTSWRAPSNIALIKYWGKRPHQLPANPSLSFTLESSATITRLSFRKVTRAGRGFDFDILMDEVPEPAFRPKIETFMERAFPFIPFLKGYHFTIETTNSFPHSSGIASSASGMAALALCLVDLEKQAGGDRGDAYYSKKTSFLARLGSGSASRSIEGPLMQWGKFHGIPGSSDLYAIPYPFDIHKSFHAFRDTILLVDQGQKQVSSTLGHGLMKAHPFADSRYEQALANLQEMKAVFASGDLDRFARITEIEALSLHAMMMTSRPYFILMKPNTLEIIHRIWDYRGSTGVPLCFTLDAGANVHLLYPEEVSTQVSAFITDELLGFCENRQYICDQIGYGAKKM